MLETSYQNFVYTARYARWREQEKRRETWDETVTRYCEFFKAHLKENYGFEDEALFKKIYNAIYDLEVMPSMRALMTAGPALKRDHMASYNPVSGDTRIVTKEYGNVPIEEIVGERVTVLNKNGDWAQAVINNFGHQNVYTVNIRLNSNTKKSIRATPNHRWVLNDDTVKSTAELSPGDRIAFVTASKLKMDGTNLDYRLGIIHGLVYGDGTQNTKSKYDVKRNLGYKIRLCGKNQELLKYFDGYKVSYPNSCDDDPVVYLYDGFAQTHDLKSLPDSTETEEYLLGFFRGWFAADGSVSRDSSVTIFVEDKGKEWLLNNIERLGFVIQSFREAPKTTNFGERTRRQWIVKISRSSIELDDLLCSWKKDNFRELQSHWVVDFVEDRGEQANVFCATVPDTNTFVLEQGLVTGNCAFMTVSHKHAFDETMYILSCGTGVGFSVERQYTNNLPEVPDELYETEHVISVADSKLGWASSYRSLISMLYDGSIPKWDMSKVRPAGARLKTFGGRASGPEPLERLFEFTVDIFKKARGRKLNSLECHDLMCKVGECIVVGGVRRSAMISLSNLTDQRMRHAKDGQFWNSEPQRALANNSVAYTEKPDMRAFLEEWSALYSSGSGERGIFSRIATERKYDNHRRDGSKVIGTNPCSEILLRDMQTCNLTEVVVRPWDTEKDLLRKHEIAAILGTFQSTLTDFRYLRRHWKNNAEEERLLGVSMTGIAQHPILGRHDNPEIDSLLEKLREHDVATNKKWAKKLGINQSAAVTTVKPSGSVSQLVNSTSGIHPHTVPSKYKYFVRRVQNDFNDPLTQFCIDKGYQVEQSVYNPLTAVISFPLAILEGTVRSDELGAIDQMKLWLKYAEHYSEHSISCTVYYDDDEFLELGAFVYKHFDKLTGVSFLPRDGGIYQQAPFQGITKEEYDRLKAKTPNDVDWKELGLFEKEDNTRAAQTLACTGNQCEVNL